MTEDDGFQTIHATGVDMAQWKDPIQAARNEALEKAAREVDCDCKYRDTVIAVSRKKSGNGCRYAPCCGALAAVAIRALKDTSEGDT